MNRMIHTSNTARYYDHNVTTFKDVMKIFIIFVIKIDGDKKNKYECAMDQELQRIERANDITRDTSSAA